MFGAEGWREALLSALPAGVLPAQWGGSGHEQQVCLGGEVSQDDQDQYQPQEITGQVVENDHDDDHGLPEGGQGNSGPGYPPTRKSKNRLHCWKET